MFHVNIGYNVCEFRVTNCIRELLNVNFITLTRTHTHIHITIYETRVQHIEFVYFYIYSLLTSLCYYALKTRKAKLDQFFVEYA